MPVLSGFLGGGRRRGVALVLLALVCAPLLAGWTSGGDRPGEPRVTATSSRAVAPVAGKGSGPVLENLSLPPGLDTLTGIVGAELERPLELRVTEGGRPVAGAVIEFLVLVEPAKADGTALEATRVVTGSDGRARTSLTLGTKEGMYAVGAFLSGAGLGIEPVRFRAEARGRAWVVFLVFGLLGGLGIFLLGMELSSEGLKRAAGERMRGVLGKLTGNRVLGLVVGTGATAVLQSSSATTVMLVGFVSATMMNLTQAIGVTLGAKIGTTVTAQLIAFNLAEYSLVLVAVGVLLRVAAKRQSVRRAGDILLGFGFIFFGLGVMGTAMKPLRAVPAFTELLVSLGEQPLLGVLVAVGFTAVVQSSAATIGLAIALCASGMLSLEAALPLAWGAHVGTCATALLASLGAGREGKQVAVAHLLVSVLGVAIAFPFLGYLLEASRWLTAWMGSVSVARELTNGHMIFTIVTGFALLPFVRQIEWLTKKLVPPAAVEAPFGPVFINDAGLEVPALALEQARREILRMADIVRGMLARSMDLLTRPDETGADGIARDDDKVDILEKAIRPFLARAAQAGLDPVLSTRERAFIYAVQDLEGIGDVITKELAPVSRKLAEGGAAFSAEGLAELGSFHGKVLDKFDRVIEVLGEPDRQRAEAVIQLGFKERAMERRLREAHISRLHAQREETVQTSAWHLSVLSNLRAVVEKLDNVARTILEEL